MNENNYSSRDANQSPFDWTPPANDEPAAPHAPVVRADVPDLIESLELAADWIEHITPAELEMWRDTKVADIKRDVRNYRRAITSNSNGFDGALKAVQELYDNWQKGKAQGSTDYAEGLSQAISAILAASPSPSAPQGQDNRPQWSKEPPTEQADYWNWDGDPDHAPMIYHLLWSGTAKKCFVSIGQYDITNAIFCDTFGGWWLKIEQPAIPSSHDSANGGERSGK